MSRLRVRHTPATRPPPPQVLAASSMALLVGCTVEQPTNLPEDTEQVQGAIRNGTPVTNPTGIAKTVFRLTTAEGSWCTSTLIRDPAQPAGSTRSSWVLSAAHCIRNQPNGGFTSSVTFQRWDGTLVATTPASQMQVH